MSATADHQSLTLEGAAQAGTRAARELPAGAAICSRAARALLPPMQHARHSKQVACRAGVDMCCVPESQGWLDARAGSQACSTSPHLCGTRPTCLLARCCVPATPSSSPPAPASHQSCYQSSPPLTSTSQTTSTGAGVVLVGHRLLSAAGACLNLNPPPHPLLCKNTTPESSPRPRR
jgi:hypothetical protein